MTEPFNIVVHQLRSGDVILAAALVLLGVWAGFRALLACGKCPAHGRAGRFTGLAWQLGALLGLEQAYEFTRGQIPYKGDVAIIHAYRLLDFEWRHGFFIESRIERFFLQFPLLMSGIDLFYVLSHAFVTLGVLIWIYTTHQSRYPFTRNMLMLTTAIALVAFYVYPTAPPRMLPNYGFVDPAQIHHLVNDGGAQPGSYTYNPFAAMPSLHVAYAIVVSWAAFGASRRLIVRVAALIYPVAMTAAVVISGNHWLLDVVGAIATVALARSILFALIWTHTMVSGSVRPVMRPRTQMVGEVSS